MEALPADTTIVYVDECGINKHLSREYGRSLRGKRVYLPVHGRKYKKLNIVSALRNNEMICTMEYACNTTSKVFSDWFENALCPTL